MGFARKRRLRVADDSYQEALPPGRVPRMAKALGEIPEGFFVVRGGMAHVSLSAATRLGESRIMTTPLGANHRTHLLVSFLEIHRRLAELAEIVETTKPSPFSRIVNDLSPTEAKVVQDHFARIRAAMLSHLQELDIPLDIRQTSLRWSLQTALIFLQVTIDDMGPKRLSGYGPLDTAGREAVVKIQQDLERLLGRVRGYLHQGLGRDLSQRLARLETSRAGMASLPILERIISRWKLVEFRPVLDMIIGRLEDPRFEIAVFGRVSSGKSSLLNHVAAINALPVGVTPVRGHPRTSSTFLVGWHGLRRSVTEGQAHASAGSPSVPVPQLPRPGSSSRPRTSPADEPAAQPAR
jgi:dynamin family protein